MQIGFYRWEKTIQIFAQDLVGKQIPGCGETTLNAVLHMKWSRKVTVKLYYMKLGEVLFANNQYLLSDAQ